MKSITVTVSTVFYFTGLGLTIAGRTIVGSAMTTVALGVLVACRWPNSGTAKRQKSMLQMVREFHKRFECYIQYVPSIPRPEVIKLRADLITEEYNELMTAMAENDMAGIADAIADLHYVLSGTSLVYGIPEDEVFTEVHRSNMAKAEPDGTVHRRADGKILKAKGWTPPDIEGILWRAGWNG